MRRNNRNIGTARTRNTGVAIEIIMMALNVRKIRYSTLSMFFTRVCKKYMGYGYSM